jgi:hypothetical protein
MLIEKYLEELDQFQKESKENENLKEGFDLSRGIELSTLFFICLMAGFYFIYLLNHFYDISIHVTLSLICFNVFLGLYFIIKINPFLITHLVILVWVIGWLEKGSYDSVLSFIFCSFAAATPFLCLFFIYFYFKRRSYHCSYIYFDKKDNELVIKQNKITEMRELLLKNKEHKKETIGYLLNKMSNNQELNNEELIIKNDIIKSEPIYNCEHCILKSILEKNNQKEELSIENI